MGIKEIVQKPPILTVIVVRNLEIVSIGEEMHLQTPLTEAQIEKSQYKQLLCANSHVLIILCSLPCPVNISCDQG